MIKLHYVGFNGYHQYPKNEEGLPRVIRNWASTTEDGNLSACNHRFIVLETKEFFNIYGILSDNFAEQLQVLTKPAKIDCFGSCDEFLIASSGTNIWKCNYKNLKWKQCKLEFLIGKEKFQWEAAGNRVLKFSYQQNLPDVIVLLNNGSIWLLSEENKLRLLFPYDLEKAVDISSGLEHSLILTESGCVLTCGNGSRGQLGHGDLNSTSQPVQITALEGLKVTRIAAGGWHSSAVTDSGDLYTWGWNNYGQLSAFENEEEIGLTALPVFIEIGDEPEMKIVDVACGRRHTVVCTENGNLYSTGWNFYNQLGLGLFSEKVIKFTKCQIERGENGKVICGPWYTILVEESK